MRRSNRRPMRRPPSSENTSAADDANPTSPDPPTLGVGGERTVKKLKLSKALTIAEGTAVSDACRRMAHRKVDAVLLTDANGLLSGIVTDKDITLRVVAEGLRPDQTIISKIMTRNPLYVTSDTMAIDALQKMVHAQYAFIETLRDRMFRPSLSTIILENTKLAVASPSDPVCLAAKKMRDHLVNSVIIVSAGKPQGILTSKDVLMRVVAHNLSPELTLVEKVMTASPKCATMDTTILDALHVMHEGNFLHLPVVDKDGGVIACLDVLQITHAATSMAEGGPTAASNMTNSMMQKFWDSALFLESPEDESETRSELSALMASESGETTRSTYPPLGLGNLFYFKFEDQKGRMHRFSCGAESLAELLTAVKERSGAESDLENIQFLYEDDEGDKILLLTDSDLVGAVHQARIAGLKVLRLHLERSDKKKETLQPLETKTSSRGSGLTPLHAGVLTGAVLLTGVAIIVYLKRSTL